MKYKTCPDCNGSGVDPNTDYECELCFGDGRVEDDDSIDYTEEYYINGYER